MDKSDTAPATLLIAGIDEVGRGCLAGPVIAAAVILPLDAIHRIPHLADSKTLTAKQRERLDVEIKEIAIAWSIGRADANEIDKINILNASLLAMERAFNGLNLAVNLALVDGNKAPNLPCETKAIVGGDAKVEAISAASIIAKVHRDKEMLIANSLFPDYAFAIHKGYPTTLHLERLKNYGPCQLHRKTFGPVKKILSLSG